MTTFTTNTAPIFSSELSAPWFSRFVARLRETRAARAERRETFEALRFLTDRELEDIGLTRGDVLEMR